MSIQGFASMQRWTGSVVILAFLVAFADIPAIARTGGDSPIRVLNQDVRIEGDVALIGYDLEAPEGGTFIVAIELRREGDPSFALIPSGLTGDIGEVKSAGPRKMIRWEYLKVFPFGLSGEDYYFRIEVSRPKGFPWLWVGLGTAAAAGAAVAILSGKSSAAKPAPPGTQELPLPPGR
jgi:hypothetical protein